MSVGSRASAIGTPCAILKPAGAKDPNRKDPKACLRASSDLSGYISPSNSPYLGSLYNSSNDGSPDDCCGLICLLGTKLGFRPKSRKNSEPVMLSKSVAIIQITLNF